MRALSKADLKPSRANMHGAASLWKEKQTLSLPPTCTQLVLCEKGKFALDGEFSKNAPYKQKIIFHLTSIGKMSRIFFFALDGRAVVPKSVVCKTFGSVSHIWWLILDFISNRGSMIFCL